MSIRSRLLALLLPAMMIIVMLVSLFFYYNWYASIMKSFKGNLKSIVVSTAENFETEEIKWIKQHIHEPDIIHNPLYTRYLNILRNINTDLPIADLYLLYLQPVQKGEKVILNKPFGPENPVYDGVDPNLSLREFYILDPEKPSGIPEVRYGLAEENEQSVYKNKEPTVTPIFERKNSPNTRYMTGYAPILDKDNEVIALVAADLNLDIFDKTHRHAVIAVFLSSLITILAVLGAVYWIANKISKPVQHLNSAALDLAAGDYEENILVKGPKEITELSNTLNTLRECLLENNTRHRDASIARERLYGEYECGRLLKNRMLDQVLEEYKDGCFDIRHVSYIASSNPQGVLLDILSSSPAKIIMSLREASDEGFEGIYQLLRENKGDFVKFDFNPKSQELVFNIHKMPHPFLWSTQTGKAYPEQSSYVLAEGDYFVIASKGLSRVLTHPKLMQDWFSKVFRHFAKEGPDLLSAMLTSELNFLTKKQHTTYDIHILCFRRRET